MRRSRNCKATFKGTIVTFPLILSASLSPPAAILPLVNKKAQLMLAFFDRLKRLILNNQAFVIYGIKGFCSIKLLQATL